MRRVLSVALGMTLCLVAAGCAIAQGNPRGKATLSIGGGAVSVDYGRPSLKGRTVNDMLGKLPAGGFWRLGADKSTTFSTTTDLDFGGVTVPKGEYSLWAQKESETSWKLVFNKQHGQWGTQHNASQDLYSVPLKQETASKPSEMVTINLENESDGGEISIQWGDLELTATFKAR